MTARRPEGRAADTTGARRPECRGEGLERQGEAVGPASVDVGAVQVLNVVEQSLVDRVNGLELLVEELLIYIERCGLGPGTVEYRRRLRDLTEGEE